MLLVPQWITTCLIVGVISRFSARHSKFSTLSPRIPQFKALFSKNEFHAFLYLESPLINESTNNIVCMFLFAFNLDICCWCVCMSVCVCVCVCVLCVYILPPWTILLSARCPRDIWEVRINGLVLWIFISVLLPSSFISVSENVIFHPKDETPAHRPTGEKTIWYISSAREKMIYVDIGYKLPTQQTDKWRKNTKDKEAALI